MTYPQIIGLTLLVPVSLAVSWFLLMILIGIFGDAKNQLLIINREAKLAWSRKMKVKIKRLHPDAKIPEYAKPGDAGLDLTAVDCYQDDDFNYVCDTGLGFEIPEGYVGLLFPRSSNSKTGMLLTNHVGVLDSGFRGSVTFKFKALWGHNTKPYKKGDRVGQLIILPYPSIQFEEVEELSETERGANGYGSTGL